MNKYILMSLIAVCGQTYAQLPAAITQPIPVHDLSDYAHSPSNVKTLIDHAYQLSKMNLTYLYASANPKNKGMDCSGTLYYLLQESHITPPRSAQEMYQWVVKSGQFHRTAHNTSANAFAALKPGDLLFWSGTYNTKNYITHVMLYLGETKSGEMLMFGSSNGRTYQNKKMWGVSVFDFTPMSQREKAKFVGYSCIPELTC